MIKWSKWGKLKEPICVMEIEESKKMSVFGGNKKNVAIREDILELGKDTDALVCEKLGGKIGSDGKCRVVTSGVGEDGNVHMKVVNKGMVPQPIKE